MSWARSAEAGKSSRAADHHPPDGAQDCATNEGCRGVDGCNDFHASKLSIHRGLKCRFIPPTPQLAIQLIRIRTKLKMFSPSSDLLRTPLSLPDTAAPKLQLSATQPRSRHHPRINPNPRPPDQLPFPRARLPRMQSHQLRIQTLEPSIP